MVENFTNRGLDIGSESSLSQDLDLVSTDWSDEVEIEVIIQLVLEVGADSGDVVISREEEVDDRDIRDRVSLRVDREMKSDTQIP